MINISDSTGEFEVAAGGSVMNTGTGGAIYGGAIYTNGLVKVSGGVVSAARTGAVIGAAIPGTPGIQISGGFVFGHGTGISIDSDEDKDKIMVIVTYAEQHWTDYRNAYIGGDGIACAWNKSAGNTQYTEGTAADLVVEPVGAARWGVKDGQSGIAYTKGANTGFFPVSGVTVTARSSSLPPAITNFFKVNDYEFGMYDDVNENLWYGYNDQKVIATAYEYGLMGGNSATTFNPSGNMTIAEAIAVAARVHCYYQTGNTLEFTPNPGDAWYQGYVNYAINNGMLTANDFSDYSKAATRGEMAYIFSRSLPESEFKEQNTVTILPDVNSGTPYYDAILMLFKAGVLGGSDGSGTFKPTNSITRAEAAAIISRVILPATRAKDKSFGSWI
jgi:hypothetical protein